MGDEGADVMAGGAGNDYYYREAADTIVELAGEGIDTAYIDYVMTVPLDDNVENVFVAGNASDVTVYGNDLGNGITDAGGGNVLHGLGGADVIHGRDGEDLIYGGDGADRLWGEELDDEIHGGADADKLYGGFAQDTLHGDDGADQLSGDEGDDVLSGGAGADQMTGGSGADRFAFVDADVRAGAGFDRDWIRDFAAGDGDVIDLSGIDADLGLDGDQAFVFVSRFTGAAGQATLTYSAAQDFTLLRLDVDGDKVLDFELRIDGDASALPTGAWVL